MQEQEVGLSSRTIRSCKVAFQMGAAGWMQPFTWNWRFYGRKRWRVLYCATGRSTRRAHRWRREHGFSKTCGRGVSRLWVVAPDIGRSFTLTTQQQQLSLRYTPLRLESSTSPTMSLPPFRSVWLSFLAEVLGARTPRRVPSWLARMAVGEYGVAVMTELRGASNRKAKSLLPLETQVANMAGGL
jgi:hypothetical protein